MIDLISLATAFFFVTGGFFLMVGSIGIIRFPDFYTRLHSASVSDTLGMFLFVTGMILYNGAHLTSLKIFAVFIFMAITNPVGSRALTEAALKSGLKPLFINKKKEQ